MRIYSMTATFGKLNHETLTLEPGLNVISAPNEWGKSTWCAFLVNMLYGIDTKQRSGGATLPDKERYAPWSGAPMAGRIELNWNGRDITIERSSKGRIVFGNFRAFETETGLDVPELDGTNCGKMLLGVERSVFTRAGFIRLSDMPVTADEALRRRLNDLVTTGDESGQGDRLSSALKDMKNKCRYNNSGLLPQAENEREQLRRQLDQLLDLAARTQQLQQQEQSLSEQISDLSNHETTLRYNASREDAIRVERAEEALKACEEKVASINAQLQLLPDPAQAQTALDAGNLLKQDLQELEMEQRLMPPQPEKPLVPAHFAGMTPQQAIALAQLHIDRNEELEQKRKKQSGLITFSIIMAVLCALAAVAGLILPLTVLTLGAGGAALLFVAFMVVILVKSAACRKEQAQLQNAHPGLPPQQWLADAKAYDARQQYYAQAIEEYIQRQDDLQRRQQLLSKQVALFVTEGTLEQRLNQWNQALDCQERLNSARQELENHQNHVATLKAMVRTVAPPAHPDKLDLPIDETVEQLNAARLELQQVQAQLHQCKGRAEALGQEHVLRSRLDTLLRRISRLEDTYFALEMAQDALYKATTTLQRRFAPRISKQAQSILGQLTDGRYQRLTMSEDFSLHVSAAEEDTLHSAQWRSDGTVDQLYLALRLAVAQELTPHAPLVLDDALVRFDQTRLENAMTLLKAAGEEKQVIVFSCQQREWDIIHK